jgi:hypothetical protein
MWTDETFVTLDISKWDQWKHDILFFRAVEREAEIKLLLCQVLHRGTVFYFCKVLD